MREVLQQIEAWLRNGRKVAAATVVRVLKSAPRQPGAVMAVNDLGEVIGSVSGGCVESALYEEAQQVLQTGRPAFLHYGIADDQAFAVGLTCGGTIEVFVERIDWAEQLLPHLAHALRTERPVALVTAIGGDPMGAKLLVSAEDAMGSTGSPGLDQAVVAEARAMLRQGQTGIRRYGPQGQQRQDHVALFIESFAPPPRMYVFGAIDFAAATVRIGKFLGYRVTLCDARPVFATRSRFPEADEVVVKWPHEFLAEAAVGPRDAICVLTHDSKFDIPVLIEALKTPAGFIGALGSRATCERREAELLEAGVSPRELDRICAPVGLDIGGRTPEETAVSIAAELIALKNGRAGGRLGRSTGQIHSDREPAQV